jgi:NADH-quinone oxidoreductase subunit F
MGALQRVLDPVPIDSFDDYVGTGGGRSLAMVAGVAPLTVVDMIVASGLRGRGGAGFPTGLKWQTVLAGATSGEPITVAVNAAEGEPGTFKDRALLRRNPYRVLEGALVAAYAMSAPRVVVATKRSFGIEVGRLRTAVAELRAADVATDVTIDIVEGPDSYLYGEETAMLEVIDGRHPLPRVAPPFRRGLEPHPGTPVLVDNVETLANVPGIVVEGPAWFRAAGTDESPGTIVCTVSGDTRRHGVGEFEMGTAMGEVIDDLGRGPTEGRQLVAAIAGTANPLVTAAEFDTPMSYEAMSRIGSGLGTGGLIVFDDSRDPVDVGRAVSHFLAIESCGQCEPCKLDGEAIASSLRQIVIADADDATFETLRRRVGTVGRGARCALARQQESVIGDLCARFGEALAEYHREPGLEHAAVRIAPLVDLVDGRFVLDDGFFTKQPDWSHDERDSGQLPVDRLATKPVEVAPANVSAEATAEGKEFRDPFAPLLNLHEAIRADLDALFASRPHERHDGIEDLRRHLHQHTELDDRLIHPLVQRVAASSDSAVWDAELHAVDAIAATTAVEAGGGDDGRKTLDRLACDVRRNLNDDERVIYPLLRQHLGQNEQTDLADAIDEIVAR